MTTVRQPTCGVKAHTKGTDNRRCIYIALETVNFVWDEDKLPVIREAWQEGMSLEHMALYFKRKPLEVFLIVLDQIEMGYLKSRNGGIHGF